MSEPPVGSQERPSLVHVVRGGERDQSRGVAVRQPVQIPVAVGRRVQHVGGRAGYRVTARLRDARDDRDGDERHRCREQDGGDHGSTSAVRAPDLGRDGPDHACDDHDGGEALVCVALRPRPKGLVRQDRGHSGDEQAEAADRDRSKPEGHRRSRAAGRWRRESRLGRVHRDGRCVVHRAFSPSTPARWRAGAEE
jgi:hypothetical protein